MTHAIQRRIDGAWLLLQGRFGHAWLIERDGHHATKFRDADEARAHATRLGLNNKTHKITTTK